MSKKVQRYDNVNVKPDDADWFCIYHKLWGNHTSPDCPSLMKTPGRPAEVEASPRGEDMEFTDPWNCLACRDNEGLCKLHLRMHTDGLKPPVIKDARYA